MRHTALLATAAFTAMLAGSAHADSRNYDLMPFDRVLVTSGIAVHVTRGDMQSVRVETNKPDQLRYLLFEVRNDALHADFNKSMLDRVLSGGILADWLSGETEIDIHVTIPALHAIEVSAGASGEAEGFIGDVFSARASSGARLSLTGFEFNELSFGASSGAHIEADGTCVNLMVRASSGASVKAAHLECDSAHVRASSGGTLLVHASDQLDANASSGGGIDVTGNPVRRDVSESSGGSVDFLN